MNAEARFTACRHGRLAYQAAGDTGPALVLLHGIGSGATSWQGLFDALGGAHRLYAWDAPGYGDSDPLAIDTPLAADYAAALDEWLAALRLDEFVLVGHSLGALIAAAWAARRSAATATNASGPTLSGLVLASPARGYGRADPALRRAKWQERVEAMQRLGPQGLAAERAARLCRPQADVGVVERVRAVMARATPCGYGQAAYMLAHDDLLTHLTAVHVPMAVLCGTLDTITPPAACAEVAAAARTPLTPLAGVAHACYVEDAQQFGAALLAAIAAITAIAEVHDD